MCGRLPIHYSIAAELISFWLARGRCPQAWLRRGNMLREMGGQNIDLDARIGGSKRVVIWVAAVVLIVGAIIGIGTLRDDDAGTSTGDASTTISPATTETTASTASAETIETTPITSPTSATSTTAMPTTLAIPSPISATVDLTASVETLEPEQIATFPIAPPGDLFPTAYATTAPNNRIAILDDVTGVVRFIDGTTRVDIAQYPTSIPTIGSQLFVAGYFFVGPDDVLYVNEGGDTTPSMVAYARSADSYSEVARVSHGIGDNTLMLRRSGVYVVGQADPIMPYVGVDGQPSGATLDFDQLTITSEIKDVYTVHRAGHTWSVTYVIPRDAGLPDSDTCVLCPSAYLGPNTTVVLVNRSPTTGGDLQTKLTVLSDKIVTYDTDWDYIGTLDGKMLFDRLDQDSIDIGSIEI